MRRVGEWGPGMWRTSACVRGAGVNCRGEAAKPHGGMHANVGAGLVCSGSPFDRKIGPQNVWTVQNFDALLLDAMSDTTFADLAATALTGRSANPFFRREQLKFLHDALRAEIDGIRDALRKDQHVTDAEASFEIAAALRHLKAHYAGIDQKAELESEYRPKKAKDAADRTEPWGVVYIEPNLGHTPFFSVIEPLGAAIAAGSCVALKVWPRSQYIQRGKKK